MGIVTKLWQPVLVSDRGSGANFRSGETELIMDQETRKRAQEQLAGVISRHREWCLQEVGAWFEHMFDSIREQALKEQAELSVESDQLRKHLVQIERLEASLSPAKAA